MAGTELAIGVMGAIIGALLTALVAALVAIRSGSGNSRALNAANPHERATPAADMSIEFFRLMFRDELSRMADKIITALGGKGA